MLMRSMTPVLIPVNVGQNQDGSPKVNYFRFGPELEALKDGTFRLAQKLKGGSVLRGGKSFAAVGISDTDYPMLIPAGNVATFDFQDSLQEDGHAGYLQLSGIPVTPDIFVTEFKIAGDSVMNGNVNGELFAHDSTVNPALGHYFTSSTKIPVTYRNRGAADREIGATLSLL